MNKIKKDDLVVVIAGKDKDKQGKVISVDTKKNKVLVQGFINQIFHIGIRKNRFIVRSSWNLRNADPLRISQ